MRFLSLLASTLAIAASVHAAEPIDSTRLPAERMPLAPQSLLLDLINIQQRTVVVGERGHVLLSEDRQQWRQANQVPTRSTLTAVTALGQHLWAVGHDEVIIHSSDGGENWELQHADPNDSPDDDPNPLFDVLFLDAQRGVAIGAYGRMLTTEDGGESWQVQAMGELIDAQGGGNEANDEEDFSDAEDSENEVLTTYDYSDFQDEYYDYHLNAIAQLDDVLLIAAEAGNAYRSVDEGRTWQRVDMPYAGSMFGVLATPEQTFLAFGLRGHVLESSDYGLNWQELRTDSENSLMGGTIDDRGRTVLVGANGEVLTRPPGAPDFNSEQHPDGNDFADAIVLTGETLLVIGEEGIDTYTPGDGT